MTRQEWLDSLLEGSDVAVDISAYGTKEYVIGEVVRITKTRGFHVVMPGGSKTFDSTGKVKITPYRWYDICPVTPEIRASIKLNRLRDKIMRVDWDKVSMETLEQVHNLLEVKPVTCPMCKRTCYCG